MNIKHSSSSNEWHTPSYIIDRVHFVLGDIDLDPASCEEANNTVEAKNFFAEDGLGQNWVGTIFINPPGGKIGNKSQPALFWKKLMDVKYGRPFGTISQTLEHAIFIAFSIEALQTTQNYNCPSIGEFPFCIPKKRIKFDGPEGKTQPSHASAIVYVPGQVDHTKKFIHTFRDLGVIVNKR